MSAGYTTSYTKQINRTQDKVNIYLYRVEYLEKMLRNKEMSMEQRTKLDEELAEIKKQLLDSENELKHCYGENRKTFIIVVLFMFFSFLFYVVYIMIVGPK
ncbi:uncharacterized protein [Halyomorpha halys]|uniref:uncharacterized protein n=1 Tax=Halyomorpha halys TaxID=286706 RepID=UPI0006D513C9|nr:uncharacterized protein LOC106688065 [Halyomorpha halys]